MPGAEYSFLESSVLVVVCVSLAIYAGCCCQRQRKICIGVGRARDGPPSLRTGQADLPHPALQLVVSARLDELPMGLDHGEETHLPEVGVWPA